MQASHRINLCFVKGCSSIRLESIKYHEGSNLHVLALSKHINKMKPTDAPAAKAYHSLNKALFPKLQHLFCTVHALNIKARPYQDYAWVNELDERKGIEIGREVPISLRMQGIFKCYS